MCGIVAVLRRFPREATAAAWTPLIEAIATAADAWQESLGTSCVTAAASEPLNRALLAADQALKSPLSVRAILDDPAWITELGELLDRIDEGVLQGERSLDSTPLGPEATEALSAALVELRDRTWSIRHDRLIGAERIARLSQGLRHEAAISALQSVHQVLSALDRLEVRGRDSAGVCLHIERHGLDLEAPPVRRLIEARAVDPLFVNGSIRIEEGVLTVVYKTAAEIGELGDNVRRLRASIESDELLRLALSSEEVVVAVLGHTRWASVGLISEPNCHPLNEEQRAMSLGVAASSRSPYPGVVAALNGDVDNYADLKASLQLSFAEEITTDAKVIPTMIAERLSAGHSPLESFRHTVSSFVGSVAIASSVSGDPGRLYLALRGSGQALYVGLGDGCFIVASEPYGVVEETSCYLRMDGETPGNPASPNASRGQIVVLDRDRAGTLDGITRIAYDGTPLPIDASELMHAQITTRDIERGDFPHFLLKEITESSRSFENTLRGKLHVPEAPSHVATKDGEEGAEGGARAASALPAPRVELGSTVLPPRVIDALRRGTVRRIEVVGQGTAAVAGAAVARAISSFLSAREVDIEVRSMPATELSGFHLEPDMADTLVIAISQSGTTTDTNRTVDLVRARGASVVAIVNRRHSDLTDKADGVLYTSSGRDVEMSVASTKAFYSQVAAGFLLATGIADAASGRPPSSAEMGLLRGLRELPRAMERLIERRAEIARVASSLTTSKRYWAVVGNGWNRIAAEEIRIKLSELCYKSISCDVTEDKKHIDLSSEPLILVCAAGLSGSNADDVAKEVAIYRAHKATPIVIATDGEQRFAAATEVILVPSTHPSLAFVLAALAGHLFGYQAALAIDAQARPLREIRSAIERVAHEALTSSVELDLLETLRSASREGAAKFLRELDSGLYNGHLEASSAVRLAFLLRLVMGEVPLETYPAIGGRSGSPAVVIEDLTEALTRAIEELTRPIDAIKHQAKTVTVGISRTDESLLTVPLVSAVCRAVDRDRVGYPDLKTLAALDPVVARVLGYTRYQIEGDLAHDDCSIRVIEAAGLAKDLVSRTARDPRLKGTKHRVATEKRLLLARGQSDGRTFLLLPETEGGQVRGLALFHVALVDTAPVAVLRGVLQGYRNRYSLLRDAVTETEPTFREDFLEGLSVEQVLLEPVSVLAERWRSPSSDRGR